MTDHIEALERLQKLRESGAITEAEFEREKQRLLQPPAAAAPRTPSWVWIAGGAAAILLVALVVILLLRRESGADGNESASANVVSAPAPAANLVAPAPVETGIRTRPPAEQLAAAFRTAFGADRRARREVAELGTIIYRPGGLRWIGPRAVLVSPGRAAEESHAASGAMAVHYLEPAGDGFRVTGEWLNAGSGTSSGAEPSWAFSSSLSNQPMLESGGGGTWQGHTCTWTTFTEFGAGGPVEVVRLQMYQSDGGAITEESGQTATELTGTIRNVVKDRSFDVVYTGTDRFTEHYVRRGARYVLAGGETRMNGC